VRLNFVFFTDSFSELYGQRMYQSVCEKIIVFLMLKSVRAYSYHYELMGRLLITSTLEASDKFPASVALPLIHLPPVGDEKSNRERESELPMTRPRSETNVFLIKF
jgi:hypothetical protein